MPNYPSSLNAPKIYPSTLKSTLRKILKVMVGALLLDQANATDLLSAHLVAIVQKYAEVAPQIDVLSDGVANDYEGDPGWPQVGCLQGEANTAEKDYVRIELDDSYPIESIVLVQSVWQNNGMSTGKLYVGDVDSTTPSDNPLCKAVVGSGMYECDAKLSGKYIYYQQDDPAERLRICELKLYDVPNVAARYGIGTESSGGTYREWTTAQLAISFGVHNQIRLDLDSGCYMSGGDGSYNWMRVDLLDEFNIETVFLTTLGDRLQDTRGDIKYIKVQNGSRTNSFCPDSSFYANKASIKLTKDFDCPTPDGKRVYIYGKDDQRLYLCMVGVYAPCDCSSFVFGQPSGTTVEATQGEATTYSVTFPTTTRTLPAGAVGCGATGSNCKDEDYGITLTLEDGSPLPAWMTYTDGNPNDSTLTIDPALASPGDEGIYTVHIKRFEQRYPETIFQTDAVKIFMYYATLELAETASPENQAYELGSEPLKISIPKWKIEPTPVDFENRESLFEITYELVCEECPDELVTLTEEADELQIAVQYDYLEEAANDYEISIKASVLGIELHKEGSSWTLTCNYVEEVVEEEEEEEEAPYVPPEKSSSPRIKIREAPEQIAVNETFIYQTEIEDDNPKDMIETWLESEQMEEIMAKPGYSLQNNTSTSPASFEFSFTADDEMVNQTYTFTLHSTDGDLEDTFMFIFEVVPPEKEDTPESEVDSSGTAGDLDFSIPTAPKEKEPEIIEGPEQFDFAQWESQNKNLLKKLGTGNAEVTTIDLAKLREVPFPVPYISQVDSSGYLDLSFSKNVKKIEDEDFKKMKDEGDITLEMVDEFGIIVSSSGRPADTRRLNSRIEDEFDQFEVPDDDYETTSNNFNWTLSQFSEGSLSLQLTFENPSQVSYSSQNKLLMTLKDPAKLLQPKDEVKSSKQTSVQENFRLMVKLPKQIDAGTAQAVEAVADSVSSTMQAVSIGNTFLGIFAGASLSQMWGSIRVMQYIARLPLIRFGVPANCELVFSGLITVVKFDVFEFISEFGVAFPVYTQSEPFNDEFEMLGYDSKQIYSSLGSFNIFIGIFEVTALIYIVNKCCCCKRVACLEKKFTGQKLWGQFFLMFVQGHFELALAVAIAVIPSAWTAQDNVFQLEEREPFDIFSMVYTGLVVLGLLVMYVATLYFSFKRSVLIRRLKEEAIDEERKDFMFAILRANERYCPEKEKLRKYLAAANEEDLAEDEDSLRERTLKRIFKKRVKAREILNFRIECAKQEATWAKIQNLREQYDRTRIVFGKCGRKPPQKKLEKEENRLEKWFSVLLDGKRHTKSAHWLDFIQIVRQLLFVITVTCMPGRQLWQLVIFILSSLAAAAYSLSSKPFLKNNSLDAFNEIAVFLCGYHALTIAYADTAPGFNQAVGWSLILLIIIFSVVNFGEIGRGAYKAMKQQYREKSGCCKRCAPRYKPDDPEKAKPFEFEIELHLCKNEFYVDEPEGPMTEEQRYTAHTRGFYGYDKILQPGDTVTTEEERMSIDPLWSKKKERYRLTQVLKDKLESLKWREEADEQFSESSQSSSEMSESQSSDSSESEEDSSSSEEASSSSEEQEDAHDRISRRGNKAAEHRKGKSKKNKRDKNVAQLSEISELEEPSESEAEYDEERPRRAFTSDANKKMRSSEQKEESSSSSSSTDKVDSLLFDLLDQLEQMVKVKTQRADVEEEEKEATPSEFDSGRYSTSNEVSPFDNSFSRSRLNISKRKDPSKSTSILDKKRPSNVQYLEKSIFS